MSLSPITQDTPIQQANRGLIARTLRQPRAYISIGWVLLLIVASIVLPITGLLDPYAQDSTAILHLPTAIHWLGTDELGRDVLARIVYGSQNALELSLEVVVVSVLVGAPPRLWAGVVSHCVDWCSSI